MGKTKSMYVCSECGYDTAKWQGQCICGAWNTMVEQRIADKKSQKATFSTGEMSQPIKLQEVDALSYSRIDTQIGELNRVLGGGLVKGSLVLISGEPGIGKSTIIMQAAHNISKTLGNVIYVSGEESAEQIKMRAARICGDLQETLYVLTETNLENIVLACQNIKPKFLIIDSIQTMYTESVDSSPGSISQVRACGNILMKLGKMTGIPIFIVAHITKTGDLAGPKVVEHLVDCVLNFTGERDKEIRIIRAFKNRFGTTSEIGAFYMDENGLQQIENLSGTFVDVNSEKCEGSVITAVFEGSRPVMFEIQALTATANVGFPRRTAIGIDSQRLNMILAVLEKKGGLNLSNQDVYVNVVGGIKPEGTWHDLGVALAIYSSFRGIAKAKRVLAIGEIGLTGDLRGVSNTERIVREAIRMGYELIILPKKNMHQLKEGLENKNCKIVGVRDIREAINTYKEE